MPRVQKRSKKADISKSIESVNNSNNDVIENADNIENVDDIEDIEENDNIVNDVDDVIAVSENISPYQVEFEDDKLRTKLYHFVFAIVGGLLTASILLVCYFAFKPKPVTATEPQTLFGELHFDQESYNNAKMLIDYYKQVNTERGAFISNQDGEVYLVVGDHSYRILSNDETAELLAVSDDGEVEDVSDIISDDGNVSTTMADDGKSIIYHIKWGDTLCQIASKYDQSITDIAKLNNIKNVHLIYAGTDMKIPAGESKLTSEEIDADNAKYYQQWLDMQKK